MTDAVMTDAVTNGDLDAFLWGCVHEVERRAELAPTNQDVLVEGAAAFRAAMDLTTPMESTVTVVPVLSQLPTTSPVRLVPFVPTPRIEGDIGDRVALGLVDRVRDLGDLTCGLMLLAPGAAYPEHAHPPQEIYLPVLGDGQWRFGGSEQYRNLAPDELVYNKPGDRHGAIAGDEALLALYLLWSS